MRDHIRFFLNGQPQTVLGKCAFTTLTDYLRRFRGLCGTKVVCSEGDCGACTVLVGRPVGKSVVYQAIDACIQFVYQIDGTHVVTVEGLSHNGDLHPVQRELVEGHGSQCGFCTPGFVMTLAGWTENGCRDDQRLALTGNLCRCTGYQPILDAAERLRASDRGRRIVLDAGQLRELCDEPVRMSDGRRVFFAPTRLEDAIAFKAAHPKAVVVAGGTELGVWHNKRGADPATLLSLARIPGLNEIAARSDRIRIGANVTFAQIERELLPLLPAFGPIVRRFGSPQIRAVATLAGNIVNGSPIADSLPLLMVLDAELDIVGPRGRRTRSINGFYTGYKSKDLADDELLTACTFTLPEDNERLRLYKVSRRNDLDIATFGAAIRISEIGGTITSAALAYSGVAPVVIRLPQTEKALVGQPFDESLMRAAGRMARNEISPITDVRGGRDFRLQLAENILRKFYFEETSAVGHESLTDSPMT